MARKSKGFGKLLNQQRKEQQQQKALKTLEKKVKEGSLGDKIAGVITNPKDQEKMSEVIEAFIEPYKGYAKDFEQHQKMLTIAVAAWNLALLPEDQQQSTFDECMQTISAQQGAQAKQDIEAILQHLVNRKKAFFAHNNRYIIDFQLLDTGHDYHLSVMSTLNDQSNL